MRCPKVWQAHFSLVCSPSNAPYRADPSDLDVAHVGLWSSAGPALVSAIPTVAGSDGRGRQHGALPPVSRRQHTDAGSPSLMAVRDLARPTSPTIWLGVSDARAPTRTATFSTTTKARS